MSKKERIAKGKRNSRRTVPPAGKPAPIKRGNRHSVTPPKKR